MIPQAWWLAFLIVVLLGLCQQSLFTVLGRVRTRPARDGDLPFFVFVIPCLNEEVVIGRSLDTLLGMAGDFAVLVIDDGSDDGTARIVEHYDPRRVWLLRRTAPNARQGKGAALNHAFRYLLESGVLAGRDPHNVVVAVLDADGRLRSDALAAVAPHFQDRRVGAVQVGVRMYNAGETLLARMQDMEFVVFTELYQRARNHLTTVGLGGNGQFVRLAALQTLEGEPWSDCLTEDLELGIRLRLENWINVFEPATWVEQQAVTRLPRLVRQRARWFQGHLQCARLLPAILNSDLPDRAVLDLSWHLLAPVMILAMSLWSALFVVALAVTWAVDPTGSWQFVSEHAWILPAFYALSIGPAALYGALYKRRAPELPVWRVVLLAHAFIGYGYIWFAAGWRAVWQVVSGRRGWAKTSRTPDAPADQVPALPAMSTESGVAVG
jgi:cellulose synthase/poly-beta-1,6-N-acetylglucosamine synthase-like glycosyltransferase